MKLYEYSFKEGGSAWAELTVEILKEDGIEVSAYSHIRLWICQNDGMQKFLVSGQLEDVHSEIVAFWNGSVVLVYLWVYISTCLSCENSVS